MDASPVELEEAVTMDEDDLSEDEEDEDDDEHDVSNVWHLLCPHQLLFCCVICYVYPLLYLLLLTTAYLQDS